MIKETLKKLTNQKNIYITSRGNSAIEKALSKLEGTILIPEEGGWLSYRTLPKKLGLEIIEVKCDNAIINLEDLKNKTISASAFLYQNPGGYHAEQPMKNIFEICKKNNCLVILDVSGSLGTPLCNGNYADVLVGSFGKWKLVEAKGGGFISSNGYKFKKDSIKEGQLDIIKEKLIELPKRIKFLTKKRNKVIKDLEGHEIINKDCTGFVVIIKYKNQLEKENIINYCNKSNLEYTECPRYIRLNKEAISIEVKRL